MPSFIRPTYKIVMEEFSSWRPCLGCFHSSRRSSPTADIKDRNLRKRLQKFCRISTLKSSNAPIGPAPFRSCPNAGSSIAPSPRPSIHSLLEIGLFPPSRKSGPVGDRVDPAKIHLRALIDDGLTRRTVPHVADEAPPPWPQHAMHLALCGALIAEVLERCPADD